MVSPVGLRLGFVPVKIDRRVALQVQCFLVGFAQPRVKHKLRRAAAVADALGLGTAPCRPALHVPAGRCEGLQEHGAAVLQSIENRAVELGSIGHRNLATNGESMPGQEGFLPPSSFRCFFPCVAEPKTFMSLRRAWVSSQEFCPPYSNTPACRASEP